MEQPSKALKKVTDLAIARILIQNPELEEEIGRKLTIKDGLRMVREWKQYLKEDYHV